MLPEDRGGTPAGPCPGYEIPAIGEAIRVYDASQWGRTVPGVYLGYELVAEGFFMHNVRTDDGTESVASHAVYRRIGTEGEHWEPLTPIPRIR